MKEKDAKSKRKVEGLELDLLVDDFFVYEFLLKKRAA